MAFDGYHVVVQGGDGRSETWVFDGARWDFFGSVPNPGPRSAHTMAYDSHRQRVVLFGGANNTDTWEFDGVTRTWKQVQTAHSPPGRASAMMAYDPVRGVVVLAGGRSMNGGGTLGDTWIYDGVDWTDVTPTSGEVPVLALASMAFDPESKRLIAFGGCEANGCVAPSSSRTLAWNGATWVDLGLSAPGLLDAYQIAGTPRGIVLTGGLTDTNEVTDKTWLFEGGQWREPVSPAPDHVGTITNDFARDQLVMVGGTPSETWLLSASGWRQDLGATPVGDVMAYDPSTRTVLLFNASLAQTWEWNGSNWTQRISAQSPPGQFGSAMAFDGTHVTVFGGVQAGPTGETWSWINFQWTKAAPATVPPARIAAIVGYDPVRKQLVMFGGFIQGAVQLGDTWTYDGTDWTRHDVAVQPPHGSGGVLVWNAARQRLVLGASWEWDGAAWFPISTATEPPPAGITVVAASLDGAGTIAYGVLRDPQTQVAVESQLWEHVWQASLPRERCDGSDLDDDKLTRCADPDCWTVCSPLCPPATSCNATQTCGDGTCDQTFETCRTCPADCTCTSTCGDSLCDPGETGCPGDCP